MPQYSYRQVADLYNTLQKAGVVSEGLSSWSSEMNRLTGTDLYGQGVNDNWVKQGSVGIDRILDASGLPSLGAQAGREVGSWIGAPDQGEAVGRGLPRMAINFAPMVASTIATGGAAAPLWAAAGLGATGLLSGAESYTNTGSVASGVISGATNVLMPGVAGLAERSALGALGGRVLSGPISDTLGNVLPGALGYVDNKIDATLAQRAGSFLAGQAAAAGLGEAGSGLEAAMDPNRDYSFDPKAMLLNMTLGQLPFATAHLAGSAFRSRGPYADMSGDAVSKLLESSKGYMEKKIVDDAANKPSPLAEMPDVEQEADPVAQAKTSALLAATRTRMAQLEPNLATDPDANEEYSRLSAAEIAAMNASETTGGTGVMGESLQPDSDRFQVSGTEHFYNPKTGYRIVKVGDDPGNAVAGFTPGQLIGYSTKFEPAQRKLLTGDTAYSIPTRYHDPNVVDRTPVIAKPESDAQLPLQPVGSDRLEAIRQQATDFSAATDKLAKATDTESLRQAIESYNGIRQKYGYEPLNDKQISDYQKRVEAPTRKDAVVGLANTEQDVLAKRQKNTQARLQEEIDTFSRLTEPLRRKDAGESVPDQEVADANAIQNMYQRLQGTQRAGTFTSAIRQWETTGKEGGIPRLQKLMEETIRQGGVKAKPAKTAQATAEAAADPSPDTQEIRNVRQAVAGDAAATFITEPADHAAFIESYLDGTIVQGKFLDDPEWRAAYEDANSEMERLGVHEPERSAVPKAGGGFDWGFVDYDPATNKLGKHTLPKSGILRESQFKNMGKATPGALSDVAIALGKQFVPEAFDGQGNVDVRKLYQGLKEKGPVVEVKKLGESKQRAEEKSADEAKVKEVEDKLAALKHEVDTKFPGWSFDNGMFTSPDNKTMPRRQAVLPEPEGRNMPRELFNYEQQENDLLDELERLRANVGYDPLDVPRSDESKYKFLGPKSEQEMPGYVEGLVRVPTESDKLEIGGQEHSIERNPRYRGPHFGSEDTNVLAFFRGYEETLPDGRKAFHVIEVQSDWGQNDRERLKRNEGLAKHEDNPERLKKYSEPGHPLLASYETLALKAAIDHARSVGADSIILSDGETAMMTEGHDKTPSASVDNTVENKQKLGQKGVLGEVHGNRVYFDRVDPTAEVLQGLTGLRIEDPSQSAGMRLHYDTTLPSALAKLTGEKGERVEVGTHDKAKTPDTTTGLAQGQGFRVEYSDGSDGFFPSRELAQRQIEANAQIAIRNGETPEYPSIVPHNAEAIVGSPVFRNPDGTPKSSISGRLYPLDKASNSPFTLTEPSRVPSVDAPKPYVPITDAERAKIDAFGADSGGASLINQLKASSDPLTKELAETLEKNYPESLKRIFVRIMDQSGEGYAGRVGANEAKVRLSHALVLGNDKVRQEQVYTHELLHALTLNELAEPSKVQYVNELTALRERLINQLPEGLKAKVNSLIDSDWITRFARSEPDAKMTDLHHSPDWQQVIYGLLNNDELVSQGFSSKQMQRFMQNFKGPKKSGFGDFVNWVRRIIGFAGKSSDSEFANFLETTSNVLQQGNYVSDISNFFKTYLGQKEGNPTVVRDQGRRALGLVQSANVNPSRELMLSQLISEEPVSREYQRAKIAMEQMYKDGGEQASASQAVLGELHTPVDQLDGLLEAHLNDRVHSMEEAMDLLPQPVTDYLFSRAKDMRDVVDAVRAATNAKNEGLVNLTDPKILRKPIGETMKSLDRFLALQKTQEADRQSLQRYTQVVPDAYLNSVLSGPSRVPEVSDAVGDAVGAPKTTAFERWGWQMAQLARKDQRFAEYFGKLLTLPSRIRQMASASTTVMSRKWDPKTGTLGAEYDKGTLDQMYKSIESTPMSQALGKLLYLKQIRGKDKVQAIPYNDPEVQQIFKGLSQKDRDAVIEFDNKSRVSKISQDAVSLDARKQRYIMRDARLAMLDMGWKLGPAQEAAGTLFDALYSDFNDPQQAAIAQQKMASVNQKMPQQAFNNLMQGVQASVGLHKLLATHMAANPDWVSNKRGGDFLFDYRKNGKLLSDSADNMKQAIEIAGSKDNVINWTKNEKDPDSSIDFGNATPEMIQKIREYEQVQLQAVTASGASPDEIAAYKKRSLADQIERDVNASGKGNVNMNLKGRTLAKTDESFPWFENHIDWFTRNANYEQRALMRETAESLASEPGTKGTEAADYIRQHMEQFMAPDPEAGRTIQKIASSWALGYSLAGNIANATQTWMRGVTELIALGHGPLAAVGEMTRAWGDLIGKRLEDKPYRSKLEEKFMEDAQHDGMLSTAMRDEEAAADELQTETFKRVLNKEKPQTMGQHVSSAFGAYTTGGMALWKMGDYANNKAQLLASFRTLQKLNPKMSYEDLKKQSYLVNASVNDVGGRANRPVGPYSGQDKVTQTLAMTMMSLRSYTLGSTMQLIRHLKSGAFRPQGVTPAEVYAARKAAVYQIGVQFAAAGALGLPFASASLALLNQFFPELEVNKKVREGVSSLFGSDSQNGHILSDIALSGVPSMLGWDFASRLNAGNLLPGVSEYNGFQPEQLLGVPANMVGNFVRGVTGGQPGNFVPPAFKKISQLVADNGVGNTLSGNATARDYRGRAILNDTPGETLGTALGFQPKRLVDYNTADRLAQTSEHLGVVRQGQENQQLAEQALKGNFGTARNAILDKAQADKTYNAASAVRAVAAFAEDQTFPKDLRREGSAQTSGSRTGLLNSFNIDPSNPSEVQRLQFRKQIEQRLGLNASDPSELMIATAMDQLRAAQPNATRASLRQQVNDQMRRRPQVALSQ